ncbi:hypothetical protein FQN50_003527 [Emmonsiellopsis sp. PD_5]|nr:hypothetical protein FQN50_003527 [Emmonsiellopsis sp. PD_5]
MHYLKATALVVISLISLSSALSPCSESTATLHGKRNVIYHAEPNKGGPIGVAHFKQCLRFTAPMSGTRGSIEIPPGAYCNLYASNDCSGLFVMQLNTPGTDDIAAHLVEYIVPKSVRCFEYGMGEEK